MSAPTTTHIATAVTDHLPGIQRLAKEFGVARLEVFAEAAFEELPTRRFPIYFLATYPSGYDFGPWGGRLTGFSEALEELLGREVHLAEPHASIPSHWQATIDETRQTIYAAT